MLLTCLFINFIVASANPFHKYPYVFLLDVGNEEIQNTSAEQIRVSIPGGSLALKYPANPGADTIAHVRVSGIDFGTDLKVNIVDGGPGYNYVVLAFMGNPGVSYDAVITIDVEDNGKVTSEGSNNSAESLGDSNVIRAYSEKSDKAAMVASSDIYKYSNDIIGTNYNGVQSEDSDDAEENEDSNSDEIDDDYQESNDNLDNDSSEEVTDENLKHSGPKYVSYESFRPQLYGGVRIYPQAGLYVDNTDSRPVYDPENHEKDENVYDSDNIRDTNNNIKLDYSSVAE